VAVGEAEDEDDAVGVPEAVEEPLPDALRLIEEVTVRESDCDWDSDVVTDCDSVNVSLTE
jgi:hypothetical protein